MLFGIGIVILIISYAFKRYHHSWFNPASIFSAIWGMILCLYSLRLFQIFYVSNASIIVFIVGIGCFLIGCIPCSFSFGAKRLYKEYEARDWSFAFSKTTRLVFMILSIFALVILLIRAINTIPFWAGGVAAVKQANAEGYISYSSWLSILYTFFANPIVTLSVFVIAVDSFFNRGAFSKLQTMLTVCMLFLGYIATGSKFSLFVPVMAFLIVYFVYKYEKKELQEEKLSVLKKISLWKKIIIVVAAIIIISFLIYMLSLKYGGWLESLYMYLVGCIPCGDHAMKNMANGTYYYGMVSLNGIFRVFSQIFAFVGIRLPYTDFMNEAYNSMLIYERAINISPTVTYNAFISAFSYFYKDGGLVGVGFGTLLFGRISHCTYRRMLQERSAYSILLYLFVCYLIMFSIVRVQLFLAPTVMVLVYMIIFFRRRN